MLILVFSDKNKYSKKKKFFSTVLIPTAVLIIINQSLAQELQILFNALAKQNTF